jgi:hypothetical protein
MNWTHMYANRIIISLRATYARIKAFLRAVVIAYLHKKNMTIQGVIFLEQGKQLNTEIYVGQTIHIEPFGNCTADPRTCVHAPIERIIVGKRTVMITAKGMVTTFVGTEIRTIYER